MPGLVVGDDPGVADGHKATSKIGGSHMGVQPNVESLKTNIEAVPAPECGAAAAKILAISDHLLIRQGVVMFREGHAVRMRATFHGELVQLREQLVDMCVLAARLMRQAGTALQTADLRLAEQVLVDDADLDVRRAACEEHAQRLLALQAPVAGDLRAILAGVYCADKIERMGDLAAHVAATARASHPQHAVPAELRDLFTELGATVTGMAVRLSELIAEEEAGGFAELERTDNAVDAMHARILAAVTNEDWPHDVRSATNLALLARFHERYADQAVSVAKRLEFVVTGQLPGSAPAD